MHEPQYGTGQIETQMPYSSRRGRHVKTDGSALLNPLLRPGVALAGRILPNVIKLDIQTARVKDRSWPQTDLLPHRSAGIHDQQKKRAPKGARRMDEEQRTAAHLLSNMSMICCFSCGVTGGGVSPSAPAEPSASFALIAFAAGLMSTLATNPLPGVRSA